MKLVIKISFLLFFFSCNNKTADDYYNLACDEESKGNLTIAINYLDKAIEKNPHDIEALNNRGYDFLELKKYDLAKADFQKMLELDKNCPGAYYALGFLNYQLENYEKAILYFDSTIKVKGGGPVFLEYKENTNTKSPYSMDVPIQKVYSYRKLSEEELKMQSK
jgi:tetratricopeptide (TPR) repeat protein